MTEMHTTKNDKPTTIKPLLRNKLKKILVKN